ncbi:unnamed protein product [Aphanomyces euteiches]
MSFWFMEGQLDELLTPSHQRSGAWYLYQWYGGFSGNTISVTPPSQNGAIQGLGYYDSGKKLAAVIFGGGSGSLDIRLTGIPTNLQSSGKTTVEVWGVDNSNKNTSSGTYLISSTNYTVASGAIQLTVNGLNANSAYQLVLKPGSGGTSTGFDPNAYYKIINRQNGKALDSGGNVAQGSATIQWAVNGGTNQQYQITAAGSGNYKIVNRQNGMAVDSGGNVAQGTATIQWTTNGDSNQQYQITDVGGGYYKLVNVQNGMALDSGGNVAQGTSAIQWADNGGTNQQFQIIKY